MRKLPELSSLGMIRFAACSAAVGRADPGQALDQWVHTAAPSLVVASAQRPTLATASALTCALAVALLLVPRALDRHT